MCTCLTGFYQLTTAAEAVLDVLAAGGDVGNATTATAAVNTTTGAAALTDEEALAPCLPCPDGGLCRGGRLLPEPRKGFWAFPGYPTEIFPCAVASRCPCPSQALAPSPSRVVVPHAEHSAALASA